MGAHLSNVHLERHIGELHVLSWLVLLLIWGKGDFKNQPNSMEKPSEDCTQFWDQVKLDGFTQQGIITGGVSLKLQEWRMQWLVCADIGTYTSYTQQLHLYTWAAPHRSYQCMPSPPLLNNMSAVCTPTIKIPPPNSTIYQQSAHLPLPAQQSLFLQSTTLPISAQQLRTHDPWLPRGL